MASRLERFTDLDRRLARARMMVDAKIQEHAAQVMGGDNAAADRARVDAIAQLEACLDLSEESVRKLLKRGF